jgi:predicted GNAT family N-acyltransferase
VNVDFRIVQSAAELLKVFAVRSIVFCGEQHVPYAIERDDQDFGSLHILGEIGGEPVGAGRIRFFAGYAKLERIAVRKSFRGRGLGRQLTDFMVSAARERGYTKCEMHAQAYLEKFYERHGFRTVGERFQEAGIEHCRMIRVESDVR